MKVIKIDVEWYPVSRWFVGRVLLLGDGSVVGRRKKKKKERWISTRILYTIDFS
jgi:hypothetical protein